MMPPASLELGITSTLFGCIRIQVLRHPIFVTYPSSPPGHMIRLPGGEEGYVTKIGWRSTWIRMQPNNVLVIPNSKLAGGIIINYDLPQREIALTVPVGVHHDSDLGKVERVTLEVAREVQRSVEGAVAGAEPVVRFLGFGDSSIQFNV